MTLSLLNESHNLYLWSVFVLLLSLLLAEKVFGQQTPIDVLRVGVYIFAFFFVIGKAIQHIFPTAPAHPRRIGKGHELARKKRTEEGSAACLEWVSCEMQGWRPAMEDAICIMDSLPEPLSSASLFGVFDGHGGKRVANIVAQQFPKVLAACTENLLHSGGNISNELAEAAGIGTTASNGDAENGDLSAQAHAGQDERAGDGKGVLLAIIEKALHVSMLTLDDMLRKGGMDGNIREDGHHRNAFDLVGSTAIIVYVDRQEGHPRNIVVANCGDSRAVLCRSGQAVELSEDHKPELPKEEARIRGAGGYVAMVESSPCHRVDGWGLNLSRALGDFHYKSRLDLPPEKQKVCAVPDVRTLELHNDADEFMLLGCDGIFELNTSQRAVDLVRGSLSEGATLRKAVEHLLDKSCTTSPALTCGKGMDNCTAIVVRFT
mmetsp:Transcript_58633/g.163591  ORF Transcript_58633/g.163591 Transcript_58633/m.163591 type:complete len:433 (-) Transcript_58633:71-1369(-)